MTGWLARLRARVAEARGHSVKVVEVHALSPSVKLAVVDWAGEQLLVSMGRDGVRLVARERAQERAMPLLVNGRVIAECAPVTHAGRPAVAIERLTEAA